MTAPLEVKKTNEKNQRAEFKDVLTDELDRLDKLRGGISDKDNKTAYERARHSNLAGLAFSGGGIRSATYNLGVIQAMARYGLLSRFDYLSTVSGGGYIGGWLSALLQRKASKDEGQDTHKTVDEAAVKAFQSALKTHPDLANISEADRTVGFDPVEHLAVRYLRRYSNYLSPKLGLSGDMLAAVSIFLRNFTLIQLTLISFLASILLFAHTLGIVSDELREVPAVMFAGSILLFLVSVWRASRLSTARKQNDSGNEHANLYVNTTVIVPLLTATWLLSVTIVNQDAWFYQNTHGNVYNALLWIAGGVIGYGLTWVFGYSLVRSSLASQTFTAHKSPASRSGSRLTLILPAIFSGALLGLLLYATVYYLKTESRVDAINPWHATAFGPPLLLLLISFVVTVHIGAARREFCSGEREWFARLGGLVLLYATGWSLLYSLVLYAPPFVQWLNVGDIAALAVWAGGSGAGAWLARRPAAGDRTQESVWKTVVTRTAPWLFVAGLGVLLAYITHLSLVNLAAENGYSPPPFTDFNSAANHTLQQLNDLAFLPTLGTLACIALFFCGIAWRLDINLFSLHTMYSNRLGRAYLGASNAGERHPNPFSGFDDNDDLPFDRLDQQRPIPIINTAINMTGGDDLAWQTRRAASFAFTPCWAGYETRSSQGIKLGAYRPTKEYAGGLKLGTLIAVSGAAASPNMGYHTSASVAALLTAFNLRLGRWCGNPALEPDDKNESVWKDTSPSFAASPILAELTGSATAKADWINLTDGGHFENLGVYELIRRRCRLIVVTDVGADPHYQFEDLANLLRKCWTDLGVNIAFDDIDKLRPDENGRCCGTHAAVGHINYRDNGPDGTLIYIKSSLTGSEWPDIRQYADTHTDFPHQTTADQFFDENQFEAYRHLGYKATAVTINTLLEPFLGGDGAAQQLKPYVTVNDIATTLSTNRSNNAS